MRDNNMTRLIHHTLFALAVFGIYTSPLYAQSKEETIQWILDQSEDEEYKLKFEINDGELISIYEKPYILGGEIKKSIPIASITKISFSHTDKYLTLLLECATNDCVYMVETDSSDKFMQEEKQPRMLFEIYKKTDKALIPRMEKAWLHLVKLHGGKASFGPWPKKKEAF
jgi:hypothetical protein